MTPEAERPSLLILASAGVLHAPGLALDRLAGEAGRPLGVGRAEQAPLPARWLPEGGGRVSADRLLDRLEGRREGGEARWLLAVVDRPLAGSAGEPVFGEAAIGGRCALVGTADLGGGRRLRERLRGEIAHELGHAAGLEHCADPGCVMRPVVEPTGIDARGTRFCASCRAGIASLRRAPAVSPPGRG